MTPALAVKEALVSLRLPQGLLARLDGAAQQLHVTRSGLVRRILGAYLRREGKVVVQVVRRYDDTYVLLSGHIKSQGVTGMSIP